MLSHILRLSTWIIIQLVLVVLFLVSQVPVVPASSKRVLFQILSIIFISTAELLIFLFIIIIFFFVRIR